ncbi:MAG: YeeE/YedE family protein [Proteobacteria bacterium]|uniref:DUF6691 family protein n=1 Tax=Rudaea sp. TaxID=2136325 RepID=UPI0032206A07|nr:YeeE/YedE family protein [Pseudomonadota bacterium]
MRNLLALTAGLLFGLGLDLGGMTRPSVVLGFLDVAGAWNPQLLFVMAGAVTTTAIGYLLVLRRRRPLFAERFSLPSARAVDARLLAGAAVFGIGWGLVGYCPGPALASLAAGSPSTLLFVAMMALGWLLGARLPIPQARNPAQAGGESA